MGIFEPYRAIGYITSEVPFSVQRLGTETFVTVSVGKAWQVYDVSFRISFYLAFHSSITAKRLFLFSFGSDLFDINILVFLVTVC